jgi:hypothetical protein
MKTQYLMAIDVGGGSGRCLLLDPETGAIKTAKNEDEAIMQPYRKLGLKKVPPQANTKRILPMET